MYLFKQILYSLYYFFKLGGYAMIAAESPDFFEELLLEENEDLRYSLN